MKTKIARLTTTPPNKFIDVSLRYDKGGINYANYQHKPRGYYLSVTPLESRDLGNGVVMESITMFAGVGACVQETARYNAKQFQQLADAAPNTELYRQLLEDVLNRSHLLLAGVPVIQLPPVAQAELQPA